MNKIFVVLIVFEEINNVNADEDFWLNLDEKTKANIDAGLRDFNQNRHVDFFEYMRITYGISPAECNDESQNQRDIID